MNINQRDWQKLSDEVALLKRNLFEYKRVCFYDCDDVRPDDANTKRFEIYSLFESHAAIQIVYEVSQSVCGVCFLINGATVCRGEFNAGKGEISFDCILQYGINYLDINFPLNSGVEEIKVFVTGYVYKRDYGSRIAVADIDGAKIITFKNGAKNCFSIIKKTQNSAVTLLTLTDKICAVSKLGDFFVLVSGNGRAMTARILNAAGEPTVNPVPFSADSDSFTGATFNGGALFYSVEKGKIKKYLFDDSLNLTVTDTGSYGKEIFDCGENAVAVVGFDDKIKFIETN